MAVPLVAMAFALWLAGSAAAQGERGDEVEGVEETAGREVYDRHCSMCHGSDAEGMPGMHPSLHGAVDRLSAEGVEVAIRNGRQVTPPMPAFEDRLSDTEIDDLVAYIDSLPSGPRNGDDGSMGGMGDGGMMDGMMGDGGNTMLWVAIVVLAAIAAGLGGYLIGRRSQD